MWTIAKRLTCSLVVAATCAAATAQTRRALLIGICNYRGKQVSKLRAPLNDIELVGNLLRTRFAYTDVRFLRDRAATRAGILRALEKLVRDTHRGDHVWLHYSGHGSQVPDLNGDEIDGLDETLMPIDARTGEVADIVDDEIEEILGRLVAKRVVLFFDSCHAGSVNRSRNGAVERRFSGRVDAADMRLYRRPVLTERRQRKAPTHLLLTATHDDEQAMEARVGGLHYGLFTQAFVRAVSNAPVGITARRAAIRTAQELRRLAASYGEEPTTPVVEGPSIDQPLFGESERAGARVPWLPVRIVAGHPVLANGGRAGALPGSVWAVYPPGERAFRLGRAIATGVVTRHRDADAQLRVEGHVASSELAAHRAILVNRATPSREITLAFDVDTPPDHRQQLRQLLEQRVRGLRVVAADEKASFTATRGAGSWTLFGAGGTRILDRGDAAAVSRVLARAYVADLMRRLENPASALQLRARVAGPNRDATKVVRRGPRPGVAAQSARTVRYRLWTPADEKVTHENGLQVEIHVNRPSFITIVSVDSSGAVWQLFPYSGANKEFLPKGRIPAGSTLIPDRVAEPNVAGFHIKYLPPAGLDTTLVFATADLATAELIRDAVERMSRFQDDKTGTVRPEDEPERVRAVQALRKALLGVTTRGFGKPVHVGTRQTTERASDWTVVPINIAIEEK